MPAPLENRAVTPAQAELERADRILHGAVCAARCVGYLTIVLLARQHPWFADLMAGVLLGDVASWAVAAARDARAHPRAVAIEGALYALVLAVWSGLGGEFLTADLEQRALTMLGFLGTFSVKISWFVWTVTHGHRE
jgi:hypothetical protein